MSWRNQRSSAVSLVALVALVALQSIRTSVQTFLHYDAESSGSSVSKVYTDIHSTQYRAFENATSVSFSIDQTRQPTTNNATTFTGPDNKDEYAQRFRETGGIFVFLHIPKTGGSMVREFLSSQSIPLESSREHEEAMNASNSTKTTRPYFFAAYNLQKWKQWLRFLNEEAFVKGLGGRSVFLESHLQPHPHILLTKVQEWKRIGQERGVPVFAFTIVREPIAHAKSWFRYVTP